MWELTRSQVHVDAAAAAATNGTASAQVRQRERESRQQHGAQLVDEAGLAPRSASRGHKERTQQYAARPPSGSFSQPQTQTVPAHHNYNPPPVYVSPAVAAAAVTDNVEVVPPPFPPRMGSSASSVASNGSGSGSGSASGHHSEIGGGGAQRSQHSQNPGHPRRSYAHTNGVGATPLATDMGSAASEPPLLVNGSTSRLGGGRNTPRWSGLSFWSHHHRSDTQVENIRIPALICSSTLGSFTLYTAYCIAVHLDITHLDITFLLFFLIIIHGFTSH